jgi:hypothetical protein
MQQENSAHGEAPTPQVRQMKTSMAETPVYPFQAMMPGRAVVQFGLSFRHLAALHAMQGLLSSDEKRYHNIYKNAKGEVTSQKWADDKTTKENELIASQEHSVAVDAVLVADALAAELDRTEGGGNDASEDSALLDHFEKHFCKPCQVNGGADDGKEGKTWVLAAHGNWTLREALRTHKAGVDAGEIETREGEVCPGCGKPSNHMEPGHISDHWGVWHVNCEKEFWMGGTGDDDRTPPHAKRKA